VASATYQTRITIPDSGAPQTTLSNSGPSITGFFFGRRGARRHNTTSSRRRFRRHRVRAARAGAPHLDGGSRPQRLRNATGQDTVPAAAGWSPNVAQGIFRSACFASIRTCIERRLRADERRPRYVHLRRLVDQHRFRESAGDTDGQLASSTCEPFSYPHPIHQRHRSGGRDAEGGPSAPWPGAWAAPPIGGPMCLIKMVIEPSSTPCASPSVSRQRGANALGSFGFREIEQRQADPQHVYYYLNGVRVNFRGDSLQGPTTTASTTVKGGETLRHAPRLLAAIGPESRLPASHSQLPAPQYNVIRIHQELAAPYCSISRTSWAR